MPMRPVPILSTPPCYSTKSGRGSRCRLAALYHAAEELVYPVQNVLRKLHPGSRRVVFYLLGPRGADDGAADVRLAQDPSERELGHSDARVRCDGAQPVYGRE